MSCRAATSRLRNVATLRILFIKLGETALLADERVPCREVSSLGPFMRVSASNWCSVSWNYSFARMDMTLITLHVGVRTGVQLTRTTYAMGNATYG